MPEQLTRHPEITLEVLASAGAVCGKGAPQEILKACPAERFCKLPGGEMCVYGPDDAGRMTQFTPADWNAVVASVGLAPPEARAPPPADARDAVTFGGFGLLAGVLLGLVVARVAARPR